jgi:hypothetical protein
MDCIAFDERTQIRPQGLPRHEIDRYTQEVFEKELQAEVARRGGRAVELDEQAEAAGTPAAPPKAARQPWPAALPEQMRAVADVLAGGAGALAEADLAERFTGRGPWKKRLPQILQTLEALGRARREGQRWRA